MLARVLAEADCEKTVTRAEMEEAAEVIDSENCIVSGSFTKESANELALVINGGQMPFKLKVVQ